MKSAYDVQPSAFLCEIVPSRFYTSNETAAILTLKPETLQVWRSTGRYPALRHRKVGAKVVLPRRGHPRFPR